MTDLHRSIRVPCAKENIDVCASYCRYINCFFKIRAKFKDKITLIIRCSTKERVGITLPFQTTYISNDSKGLISPKNL